MAESRYLTGGGGGWEDRAIERDSERLRETAQLVVLILIVGDLKKRGKGFQAKDCAILGRRA